MGMDVLKIKSQTNAEFRGKSMISVVRKEGLNLYAGWQWTIARNAPGSFALFGVKDHRDASFLQTTISSAFGSICSILVACPLDVVKTRIQSGTCGNDGMSIVTSIVKDEGWGGL